MSVKIRTVPGHPEANPYRQSTGLRGMVAYRNRRAVINFAAEAADRTSEDLVRELLEGGKWEG